MSYSYKPADGHPPKEVTGWHCPACQTFWPPGSHAPQTFHWSGNTRCRTELVPVIYVRRM